MSLENFNLSHVPVYIMSQEQLSMYATYMGSLGNRPENRTYISGGEVSAENTVAVVEYASKPFFGSETTYDVALYQAKEGASITDKMWSYKKTPASKDETLERVATVTIVANNKSGDVVSYKSEPAA